MRQATHAVLLNDDNQVVARGQIIADLPTTPPDNNTPITTTLTFVGQTTTPDP